METAVYTVQPDEISYMTLPDGRADVWLRQNIVETDEGWEADEVYFRTTLSEESIIENFAYLFENEGPTVDEVTEEELVDTPTYLERLEAVEAAVLAIAEEVYDG